MEIVPRVRTALAQCRAFTVTGPFTWIWPPSPIMLEAYVWYFRYVLSLC